MGLVDGQGRVEMGKWATDPPTEWAGAGQNGKTGDRGRSPLRGRIL